MAASDAAMISASHDESGCAALNFQGPHVPINQGYESIVFDDVGNESNPDMLTDSATGRRVQMSSCGGVVRSEEWSVTYNEVYGDWEVEGVLSGIQANRAVEGERWVSDSGGISFTMVAGSRPSSDGDNFNFYSDEGILRISAIEQGDGQQIPMELPGEPTVFQYLAGPSGGGWDSDVGCGDWSGCWGHPARPSARRYTCCCPLVVSVDRASEPWFS